MFGGQQYAAVTDVSCAWQANCAAIGYYLTVEGTFTGQAFVADEINGTWRKARPFTGIDERAHVVQPAIGWNLTASCARSGPWPPQGPGLDRSGRRDIAGTGTTAFLVTSMRGTWHAGHARYGAAGACRHPGDALTVISCATAGGCA